MKVISWNVNGLKAILKKGFIENLSQLNADFICVQEIKISKELEELSIEGYYSYFNYSCKSGYSGVGILAKKEPMDVIMGMQLENEYGEIYEADNESRVITLEYSDFYIVSVYVPHAQGQGRINYRQKFDYNFIQYVDKLNNIKDVIICGDFNICHRNIDVCNLNKHIFLDTFSDENMANFNELLDLGLIDTYRYMHPQMREYSFFTNNAIREDKNEGWRLDYILISKYLQKNIREANILSNIGGSDHCPIELVLKV